MEAADTRWVMVQALLAQQEPDWVVIPTSSQEAGPSWVQQVRTRIVPWDTALEALPSAGRLGLIVLVGPRSDEIERRAAERLLSLCRDQYADELMVLLANATAGATALWTGHDLRALGLVPGPALADRPEGVQSYRFSLHDYKPAPDWLNAKHWANPELFDKYRW